MGEERETDTVVFVGTVVNNAVLINVENGAQHEFRLMKEVGEVGDIGEVTVRHTDDIIDAKVRLAGDVGVAAIVEVLFISIKIARGDISTEARLVRRGMEVTAQEGVVSWGEVESLGFGD